MLTGPCKSLVRAKYINGCLLSLCSGRLQGGGNMHYGRLQCMTRSSSYRHWAVLRIAHDRWILLNKDFFSACPEEQAMVTPFWKCMVGGQGQSKPAGADMGRQGAHHFGRWTAAHIPAGWRHCHTAWQMSGWWCETRIRELH